MTPTSKKGLLHHFCLVPLKHLNVLSDKDEGKKRFKSNGDCIKGVLFESALYI